MPTDNSAKCRVAKSQSEPLIVEWPDPDRARLESLSHKGLVAVHYEGCTLKLMSRCTVKGAGYQYSPVTKRVNKLAIKDDDDLYMKMPLGAVQLEGKLHSAGQLNVQMTTVGRYEAPIRDVYRDDLEGDCKETTHVIHALTVGAFTFSAGADAEVGGGGSVAGIGGAGGKSGASRELLQKDGDENACEKASAANTSPPEGCAGPFQIEVMPLSRGSKPAPVVIPTPSATTSPTSIPSSDPFPPTPPAPTGSSSSASSIAKKGPPPKCKKGEKVDIDSNTCMKIGAKKPPTKPGLASAAGGATTAVCGPGQHAVGRTCDDDEPSVGPPTPVCAAGQHPVGTRCVDDEPPPSYQPPPPPTCVAGTHLENGACVVNEDRPPPPPTHLGGGAAGQNGEEDGWRPNPFRTVLWYGVYGFGLTALIAGSASLAASKSATEQCSEASKSCGPDYDSKRSTAVTVAVVADVALGLAVLSVVGIILLPAKVPVKVGGGPIPGGGAATVGGKF